MTSRTEYRLLHRQDNADRRLASIGRELGLLSETQYGRVLEKGRAVELEVRRLEHTGTPPSPELDRLLEERGEPQVRNGAKLADLLRRPRLTYADLAPLTRTARTWPPPWPARQRSPLNMKAISSGSCARWRRSSGWRPGLACGPGLPVHPGTAAGGPAEAE